MSGQLHLGITRRADGVSYASDQSFSGALRIIRPHYLDHSGQVTYTVINPGGAYFGADSYDLEFNVADSASLLITTQSATKVYRTPQGPATQDMRVRIGEGATFEYLPDQLIVYREGTYRQSTTVVMTPTSNLALGEIVTPGWSPEGKAFSFDELRMRTELRLATPQGEKPFAIDNLRLIPETTTLGIGVMEGFSHSGQMLLAGPNLKHAYEELSKLIDASATCSAITEIGIPWNAAIIKAEPPSAYSIRSLAHSTGDIESLHHAAVSIVRATNGGLEPVQLRKF